MKKTGVSLAIGLSCLLLIGAGPWPPDDMQQFLDFWSKPRASCLACRRMLDSPGCCTADADLARDNLCPACGFPKGSADCCTLQGKELCPNCGLPRTSVGCCHIL
jgi:hypothetical protein